MVFEDFNCVTFCWSWVVLAQVGLTQGLGDSYGMNLDEFGFAAPCYDGILLKLHRNITDNNTAQTWEDIKLNAIGLLRQI